MLVFSSGTSSSRQQRVIWIGTGAATAGRAGSVMITVGSGTSGAGGRCKMSRSAARCTLAVR